MIDQCNRTLARTHSGPCEFHLAFFEADIVRNLKHDLVNNRSSHMLLQSTSQSGSHVRTLFPFPRKFLTQKLEASKDSDKIGVMCSCFLESVTRTSLSESMST